MTSVSYIPLTSLKKGFAQKRQNYGDIPQLAFQIIGTLLPYGDTWKTLETAPLFKTFGLHQLPKVRVKDGSGNILPTKEGIFAADQGYLWSAVSGEATAEIIYGHRRIQALRWLTAVGKRQPEKIATELDIELDLAQQVVKVAGLIYQGVAPCEITSMTDEEVFLATWTENTARQQTKAAEDAQFAVEAKTLWPDLNAT